MEGYLGSGPESGQKEQRERLPQLEIASQTASSIEHPDRNEDAHYFKTEAGIFGVFDGVGGAPAGDLASRAAMLQLTKTAMEAAIKNADSPQALQDAIETANTFLMDTGHPSSELAIKKAGRTILKRMAKAIHTVSESPDPAIQEAIVRYADARYGKHVGHPLNPTDPADREIIRGAAARISTTVSFAKVWSDADNKRFVTTFQLGDSSIYRLRQNKLEKLTVDDSFITSLQAAKLLPTEAEYEQQTISSPNGPDYAELRVQLNAILAMNPPDHELMNLAHQLSDKQSDLSVRDIRHYVTQSMNNQPKGALMARISTTEVLSGDVLIAMTDGITDNLTIGEMQSLAERKKQDPHQLSILLTAYAGKRAEEQHVRAKPDDMTAVVVKIP